MSPLWWIINNPISNLIRFSPSPSPPFAKSKLSLNLNTQPRIQQTPRVQVASQSHQALSRNGQSTPFICLDSSDLACPARCHRMSQSRGCGSPPVAETRMVLQASQLRRFRASSALAWPHRGRSGQVSERMHGL